MNFAKATLKLYWYAPVVKGKRAANYRVSRALRHDYGEP